MDTEDTNFHHDGGRGLLGRLMNLLGLGHLGFDLLDQTAVLGQSQHIVQLGILLAVAHDIIATKTRVPAYDESNLGPCLPEFFDNTLELWDYPAGRILIPPAQPRTQQMLPTENIQWQITVLGVIAMEKLPLLMAVYRIVGG